MRTPDEDPLEGQDPEELTHDRRPRCTAKSKQSQERCRRAASPGTTVCASHGAKAPQVRKKASLRLMELIDPAITTLAREMMQADKSSDRQRAANSILDRAGVPRRIESPDSEAAKALLIDRLLALKAEREVETPETAMAQVIEAEVLPSPKED